MPENFGFIHERTEIKVLILYIMRRLPEPVPVDALVELTMCDEGISYFDVTECLDELVKTKHLKLEDKKYSLTAKGERNGEVLEKNLPYTVRVNAEDAAALARSVQSRSSMIKTNCSVDGDGGYKVNLSLSDGIGDIISIELMAANQQQANALEKGFRNKAEKVYHTIVETIIN